MKVEKNTKKNLKSPMKPAASQPVKTVAAAKPSPTKTITTIEAKIDVGFGNNLFVRGEGPGLSWEHGTPLKCVDPQTWQWSAEASDPLKVKLLLNDAIWMSGEDIVVPPGKRIEVSPAF